jgi:hypothetical protein
MLAIDFEGGFEQAWETIVVFVPKLFGFLLIIGLGYLVAKALGNLTDRVLERVGFDRWLENGSLRPAFQRTSLDGSDLLGKVVFWAVFLIALQLGFGVFGPNPVSELIQGIVAYLPNIFVAVVILVIAAALGKFVADLLTPMLSRVSGGRAMAAGAGGAIFVIGVFAALDQLEVAPTVVNGLFYGLLAIVVGSAIVAIGVGGIPVARRWLERAAGRIESKASEIKEKADPNATRVVITDRVEGDDETPVTAEPPPPPPAPTPTY